MLAFIVPLKSRRVAKSWEYVSRLFERCLRSVCAQTEPDFKVVVVCHERPEIDFQHPAVSYLAVDFAVPGRDHLSRDGDKYRKIIAGLLAAREFSPSHVMAVDADDCVSNRLTEFVRPRRDAAGWFFDSGYFHRDGARRVHLKEIDFYRWCGTSHIVRRDLLRLPESADCEVSYLYSIEHSHLRERLARAGAALEPLPFPGAVYVETKYGEGSHYSKTLRWKLRHHPKALLHPAKMLYLDLFRSNPISAALADEFGLYSIK